MWSSQLSVYDITLSTAYTIDDSTVRRLSTINDCTSLGEPASIHYMARTCGSSGNAPTCIDTTRPLRTNCLCSGAAWSRKRKEHRGGAFLRGLAGGKCSEGCCCDRDRRPLGGILSQ